MNNVYLTAEELYPYIDRIIFQNPKRWLNSIISAKFSNRVCDKASLLDTCIQYANVLNTGVPNSYDLHLVSYDTKQWMWEQVQTEYKDLYRKWEIAHNSWRKEIDRFESLYYIPYWALRDPLRSWRAARRTFVALYIAKTTTVRHAPHPLSWAAFWESVRNTTDWQNCYYTGAGSGHTSSPQITANTPFEHAIINTVDQHRYNYIQSVGYTDPPEPPKKPCRPQGWYLAKMFTWNGLEPLRRVEYFDTL